MPFTLLQTKFIMGDGGKRRLEVVTPDNQEDETCRTFVLHEEDHTLGNSLRWMVIKNPEVEFCGYSIPHPSENKINFRIQTKGAAASDVLKQGFSDLSDLCQHVLSTFEHSVNRYKKKHKSRDSMEVDST